MSTIHAVKCYDEGSGLTISLYEEGDCGYPCFTEVGTLANNCDDVRDFGYNWEFYGVVGGELFSFAVPSPKVGRDFTLLNCDWNDIKLDIEREFVRRLDYVDAVQLETEEEYDTWVAASRAWYDGDGEGYYYAPCSDNMKRIWYVREFEEMLDIVTDYMDAEVLTDSDIESLMDDGWMVIHEYGKIAYLVKP